MTAVINSVVCQKSRMTYSRSPTPVARFKVQKQTSESNRIQRCKSPEAGDLAQIGIILYNITVEVIVYYNILIYL